MGSRTNYFKIGLFVIVTTAVLIAGIIILSAGTFMHKSLLFETYMDESIQGLEVGSAVLHRGVRIGTVKQITFLPMCYPETMPYGEECYNENSKYVIVIMSVERSNFPYMADDKMIKEIVDRWVAAGLRLKLTYQGLTGISYMEADYVDPKQAKEKLIEVTWESKNIYIPSTGSLYKNLTESIESILQEFSEIDFKGIAKSFTDTLATADSAVKDAEIPKIREEIVGLATDLRQTNSLVLAMMGKSSGPDSVSIPETIAQLDRTLNRLDKFLLTQQSEIEGVVLSVRQTAENLREFSENLKQYPASIMAGPPSQKEMRK
jgi:paraquat-inducible protein B